MNARSIQEVSRPAIPSHAPNETKKKNDKRLAFDRKELAKSTESVTASRQVRLARPSEPILLPKLRIDFADFPYLHSSIDKRLLNPET